MEQEIITFERFHIRLKKPDTTDEFLDELHKLLDKYAVSGYHFHSYGIEPNKNGEVSIEVNKKFAWLKKGR